VSRYLIRPYRLHAVAGSWVACGPREEHRANHFAVIDQGEGYEEVATYAATRAQAEAWVAARTAQAAA
jgi:hypothetical protein